MKPNLESKITKLIKEKQLRSLTIDVFDTIIKYDYWPCGLRYYDLAAQWTPYFQQYLSPDLDSNEVYMWLTHAERALTENRMSSRSDILIDVITESICDKYHLTISDEDKICFYAHLMTSEITFEFDVSKPNLKLAEQLRSIKKSHPNFKIYFVSRTHLITDQIRAILAFHGLSDIFTDGISSSDLEPALNDEEIFAQLPKAFGKSFSLEHNLHLGDERAPDFLAPRQLNSLAIHYRPIRFRGLRTLVGQTALTVIEKSAYLREYRRTQSQTPDFWRHYGRLLGEIDQIHCLWLLRTAKQHPRTAYLIAGNCLYADLKAENIQTCLDLSEPTLIRAFIWLLATFDSDRWDAANLLKTLATSFRLSRAGLYNLCFKDYTYSFLAINSFSDEAFWPHFLQEIRQADPAYTVKLRTAYNYIINLFAENSRPLTIVQANPDRTAELFQNFLQLFNLNPPVSTYALDFHGKIRDLTQNPRTLPQKLAFSQGLTDSIKSFQQTKLYPDDYYSKILLPELRRTFKKLS